MKFESNELVDLVWGTALVLLIRWWLVTSESWPWQVAGAFFIYIGIKQLLRENREGDGKKAQAPPRRRLPRAPEAYRALTDEQRGRHFYTEYDLCRAHGELECALCVGEAQKEV